MTMPEGSQRNASSEESNDESHQVSAILDLYTPLGASSHWSLASSHCISNPASGIRNRCKSLKTLDRDHF